MTTHNTPEIIFLYGPAGCGKGTQAFRILKEYPEYEYIEVGEVLRSFNQTYLGDPGILGQLAGRANAQMSTGQAVDFEDWKYIWDYMVTPKIAGGQKLLFDGVFRGLEQSMFLANFIADQGKTCALFVIHITVDEAIKRLKTRYYVPGTREPFSSLTEAEAASPDGAVPTSRSDDQDPEVIRARYRNQYELQFGKCISIYQRVTGGELYIIDGEKNVGDVFIQLHQNLANFEAKLSRITI